MTSYPNTLITGKYYPAHKAKRHAVWPVIVAWRNNPIMRGNILFWSTCLEDIFQDKSIPKHICSITA